MYWYSDRLDSEDKAKRKFKDDFKFPSLAGKKHVAVTNTKKNAKEGEYILEKGFL